MLLPVGAIEVESKRGLRTKVYNLPDKKRRMRTDIAIRHTPNDFAAFERGDPVTWNDINTTIGKDFNTWYTVRQIGGRVRIEFKRGGFVDIDLQGKPFSVPVVNGNKLEWNDIAPDTDIWIEHRAAQVEIFKRLKTPAAARKLTWKISERVSNKFRVQTKTRGRDAAGQALELTHDITPRVPRGQEEDYNFVETHTGRSFAVDPVTRIKTPVPTTDYPIIIDATITENIVDTNDDGYYYTGGGGSWVGAYDAKVGLHGDKFYTGFRFQGLSLGGTETIDSAYHYTYVNFYSAGGCTPTLKVDDVDDAAVFSNSSHPPSTSFTGYGSGVSYDGTSTGEKKKDVTTAVSHIINRAGWSSGNDIRFGVTSYTGTGFATVDYYGGAYPASLVINYTVVVLPQTSKMGISKTGISI